MGALELMIKEAVAGLEEGDRKEVEGLLLVNLENLREINRRNSKMEERLESIRVR